MRSPFAYTPRRGPLQAASPAAAVSYLGALLVVSFLYSSPIVLASVGTAAAIAGCLAGGRRAVAAALRIGLGLALLITLVNPLVTSRGETVLARLGEWPLLGQVDVTAEALAAGAVLGLRAAVAILVFAVYSACVDPDRVLRLLRPLAGRSALTATLVSRMVPLAARDSSRLREAASLRGPAAAAVGKGAMARRLMAGSLDRAVDVAATLELRGYASGAPRREPFRQRSRYDRRLYAFAIAVTGLVAVAIFGTADHFATYPSIRIAAGPDTLLLALAFVAAGLAPLQPRRRRAHTATRLEAARA
jgi:energy-coupling factor transport system permease protein